MSKSEIRSVCFVPGLRRLTLALLLAALGPSGLAAAAGRGPDVTVIYLGSTNNYGQVGGVRAYSVGTTSCNVGDEPLWWCDEERSYCGDDQHPVIAQNLYRLKDGRFEQLGMSWLKHGFLSTNSVDSNCGTCVSPPHGGDQLGVGCTDTYGAGLNGSRPLGMRSEVNATTGVFPFPFTEIPYPEVIDQRLQVAEVELDPSLNPGARYWVEGQYVAADDAVVENAFNNASYREVSVTPGSFNLSFEGPTVRERPAIYAWKAVDPLVQVLDLDVPGFPPQRFHVARRVTRAGDVWHYEYAVHNLNSDRSGQSLTVQFPGATMIGDVGFRDVDHHSGEPYLTTDWDILVNSETGMVEWSTDLAAGNPNANALRWGTMFSFWFDADRSAGNIVHTLGLFKDGVPSSVDFELSELFADGFESGGTGAWSLVVP